MRNEFFSFSDERDLRALSTTERPASQGSRSKTFGHGQRDETDARANVSFEGFSLVEFFRSSFFFGRLEHDRRLVAIGRGYRSGDDGQRLSRHVQSIGHSVVRKSRDEHVSTDERRVQTRNKRM